MHKRLKIFLLVALLALLLPVILLFSIENYWPFYSLVDTNFSKDFDIAKFDQIGIGTSMQEVSTALGEPIWKDGCGGCWEMANYEHYGTMKNPANRKCERPCTAENQYWKYSDDGACTWWDFAWKSFAIDFHNGAVIEKHSEWHYD